MSKYFMLAFTAVKEISEKIFDEEFMRTIVRIIDEPSPCEKCCKYYKNETLRKYGGVCYNCKRKSDKLLKERKLPCGKCKKEFRKLTLDKYGGVCYNCKRSSERKTKRKTTIPKPMKRLAWLKYQGNVGSGKCYSCARIIYMDDHQAGHVVSEFHGGEVTIENLRPICKPCNTSCGTENLNSFKGRINA